MTKRYSPSYVGQNDGSRCQWTNCWCATGAMMLDAATRGRRRVSPMQFRKRAGALKGCRTGGLGDIMRGLAAYGVKSRMAVDVPRAKARTRLASKTSTKVYAVETDFDAWPTRSKCDFGKDFDGYHMCLLLPGAQQKRGKPHIRVGDPLMCGRLKWVRLKGVLNAAIEYNNEHAEKRDTIDMLWVDTAR